MSLEESVARREAAIINDLQSKQSGIDDKTGRFQVPSATGE